MPRKFHGQRSLAGSSPWSSKESDTTEQLTLLRGFQGFLVGSDGKVSACNAGDLDFIPGLGRSPGGGHGNPLQYFAWRIPIDRESWQATVRGCKEFYMTKHSIAQDLSAAGVEEQ